LVKTLHISGESSTTNTRIRALTPGSISPY
jgi:hypothetical protein